MKTLIAISVLLSGCASGPRQKTEAAVIGEIARSSVRVIAKYRAPDGSASNGVAAYIKDEESLLAQAAAERYCGGPIRVRSEEYLATGDVKTNADMAIFWDVAFASSSSSQKRAWRMVFDCNKSPSSDEVARYAAKFADAFVEPGIGDRLLGSGGK